MYLKIKSPKIGRFALLCAIFILFLFNVKSVFSQSSPNPPPLPCGYPVILDTICCEYITNGNFADMYNYQIDNLGDIHTANGWNGVETGAGGWTCLTANINAGGNKPDAFSVQTSFTGYWVPYNIYSSGTAINDPSLDGQYAAINIYDDPSSSSVDDRTYLEQELNDFLYAGFTYKLVYKTYHAPVSDYTANIGVYLTPNILNGYDFSIPLLNSEILHNTPNTGSFWQTIENTFTVGQSSTANNLKYITIGYNNDNSETYDPSGTGQNLGVFYIDSIHLKLLSAPDTVFYDTLCGTSADFFTEPYRYHRCATWSVVSGPATIDTSYTDSVNVFLPIEGDYIIQYELVCDDVTYTETFEYTVMAEYGLTQDTIIVCETELLLDDYTNGIDGEWSVSSGNGNINSNGTGTFYENYGIGTHQLIFEPGQNSSVCDSDTNYLWITYQPFPKSTYGNFDTDIWEDIEVDWLGNVYATGTFIGLTEIDGNQIEGNFGLEQFMVAKYDSCGSLLWYAWGDHPCGSGWSTSTEIEVDAQAKRVYISGRMHGLMLKNSIGDELELEQVYNDPAFPPCPSSNTGDNYILQLNSVTGSYEDHMVHFLGISDIKCMELALDGQFAHFLYLGGEFQSSVNGTSSCVLKINTHPNFNDPLNLTSHSYIYTIPHTNANNIINDLYYRDQHIYTIGTTDTPISFGGVQLGYNSNAVASTAWVSRIEDNASGMNVLNMSFGGPNTNPNMPSRRMTGENIYVDQSGNVVVSGLFSHALVDPFGISSNGSFTQYTPSFMVNGDPISMDAYIFKLNYQSLQFSGGFDILFTHENGKINNVEMFGYKDQVYLTADYTNIVVDFMYSSPPDDLFLSGGSVNNNQKIIVARYDISATLTRNWINTTQTFIGVDEHNVHAIAGLNDLVYTAGNYDGFMDFTFNNSTNINSIGDLITPAKAFIFRNDNALGGMFKSNEENSDKTPLEKITNKVSVFPNPSNGTFTIDGVDSKDDIYIYSSFGQEISYESRYIKSKGIEIRIPNYNGLLIVKVNNESFKVLIQ